MGLSENEKCVGGGRGGLGHVSFVWFLGLKMPFQCP